MSNPNDPSRNIAYDPLPLTSDDHPSNQLYNAPPSPDPGFSTFHTPQLNPSELGVDSSSIPAGAAQPRFMGAALYDDAGAPRVRDSYASSHNTFPSAGGNGSEYNSSVYALNDQGGQPLSGYRDDPRNGSSYFAGEQGGVPMSPVGSSQGRYMEEKRATYAPPRSKSRRKVIILAVLASLILLILAVVIPVYFAIVKPKNNKNLANADGSHGSSAHPTSTGGPDKPVSAIVSGGDGSEITLEDGSKMTYNNKHGGIWYYDENDPFNNGARPQSWSPALNETFNYGVDKIRG